MPTKLARCVTIARRVTRSAAAAFRRRPRAARARQRLVAAAFEGLENRQLFSASITFTNGVLSLNGDPAVANSMTVQPAANGQTITASVGNGKLLTVATAALKQVNVTGGSQGDYVYIDSGITVPVTITGGDGDDVVRGGGGPNTITLGNGNNWVNGRGSTNYIRVGDGYNTLLGSYGNDTLIAGNGNDSITGAGGDDSIVAGDGADSITGDSGNDYIRVGNGPSTINGGLGDDRLIAGTGLATIYAGSGANTVTTGNANDDVETSGGGTIAWVDLNGSPVTDPNASLSTAVGTQQWTAAATAAPSAAVTVAGGLVTSDTDPQAVIQTLDVPRVAGLAVAVRGTASVLNAGSPIDADYLWNFGDPTSSYNQLTGFNAAHVYATPGTYTISLTVINAVAKQSTVTAQVTVVPDTRRDVYVNAATGNDANDGSTPAAAVQSANRAGHLVGNDTDVFFARGQTFPMTSTLKLGFHDVLVGAYGTGARPVLSWATDDGNAVMVSTNTASAVGVTIQDLALTSVSGAVGGSTPYAIAAGGYGTTVLRCTFSYVGYAVNGNGGPVALTVQDSTSPLPNGTEGYFIWDQGNDLVALGNTVAGSVHEHVLRTSGASEINVAYNNFTNDDGKGCIEIHTGSYAWVTNNTVTDGDIRTGPLGLWGEPVTSATDTCVIQDNRLVNTLVQVYPGSHGISIRNNVLSHDSAQMIDVEGSDGEGRVSADIRILNNTGISNGLSGNFLRVENHTNGITLVNNLLVEPNLATGGYGAAPVLVNEPDLSSFTFIGNNVWQLPAVFYPTAAGGVNFVASPSLSNDYLTPAAWNALAQVGTDLFVNTSISGSTFAPVSGSTAASAASPYSGVFGDFNGNNRPYTGSWSAGAIQL